MSEHSKYYADKEDFRKASLALTNYQKRHNTLRKDYQLLLDLTEQSKTKQSEYNALFRASVRGLLSLIESDIYGLNQLDPYTGYDDNHNFENKFKRTFKQVCQTWNKNEIFQDYLDSRYFLLKTFKRKRDKLIHPKTIQDIIIASDEEFEN